MSAHALAGLAALNALYLVGGLAILWVFRGWDTWAEIARLTGLAAIVGVAAIGSVWTLALIIGVPFTPVTMLALATVVTLVSSVAARRRGRGRPTTRATRRERGLVVAAVGISATALLLAGLFRAARLSGLYWWDAWSFWVPKAKAIYYFGELDVEFFTGLPGSSYPPLVPVLDAAAFHAMGSPDVVTLHIQYWIFGAMFVWALAGLLAERVPGWILWPFVLLPLVAPRIGPRMLITEADLFLDFLFVLAAVLLVTWILDGDRWRLVVATILMSGMVLTKREGLLLAAVLVAVTLLTSVRKWRVTWPAVGLSAVAVVAVAAPWRIWYLMRGVAGEAPAGGLAPSTGTERLWPSLDLAFDVLLSSVYWSVLVPVAIGAIILALLVRAHVLVVFFAAVILLVTVGGGWITWAIPELEITQELGTNPIVRFMGAAALTCAAASALLLAEAWKSVSSRESS